MEMGDPREVQWIEVDAKALNHNLELFRNTVGEGTALLAVVKANAYGHGQDEVAPRAAKIAEWLGVHTAAEARHLRQIGVKIPILIMGFVSPSEFYDLDRDVHLLVSSPQTLDWVKSFRQRTGVALPVHIKVAHRGRGSRSSVSHLTSQISRIRSNMILPDSSCSDFNKLSMP
jgi:alanine racemase